MLLVMQHNMVTTNEEEVGMSSNNYSRISKYNMVLDEYTPVEV